MLVMLLIFWPKQPAITREAELPLLHSAVDLLQVGVSHLDMASTKNAAPFQQGGQAYLGLRLSPGLGNRAGVSVDYPSHDGGSVRYSWRFMLPENFDAGGAANQPLLMAQWYDQAGGNTGSSAPAVSIALSGSQGRINAALNYGITTRESAQSLPVTPGVWHSLSVLVHWSRNDDGSAALFFDDPQHAAVVVHGPNLSADHSQSMELGLFSPAEMTGEQWIYIGQVNVNIDPPP
jgi:hypothetical protein